MRQQTFSSHGFDRYGKTTRRAKFLAEMDQVVPWRDLCRLVEPHYSNPGRGRPPVGLERMLRLYFLQHWFNLSDPAAEEALYESISMRRFVGIDLGREAVPDETTILNFRHLIEVNELGAAMLHAVNDHLHTKGIKIGTGTIVDATIIHAPSSTKNSTGERDSEMHQTKKGNQWYFGMKAHVGVDSKEKIIHSAVVTPANTHDSQVVADLLHGDEAKIWGDSAYQGRQDAIHAAAPAAQDMTNRRGSRANPLTDQDHDKNTTKSRVRSKVEHVFHVMKRIFGFTKVRYRAIEKNANRVFVTCALVNIYLKRRVLLRRVVA